MSSSIAIPTPTKAVVINGHHLRHHRHHHAGEAHTDTSSHNASSPVSSSASSPAPASSVSSSCCCPGSPASPATERQQMLHQRRPSLLSSAISKQEAHVINIGDPDGPARLISYLSSSQGFTWNPEIFVPSYVDCDYTPLQNRREPVHEIFLTDEELNGIFPQ